MENTEVFFVTWTTHNSRVSERTEAQKTQGKGVWLDKQAEIQITEIILSIVREEKLKVLAYNICGDHVHMILSCTEKELPRIVQKLKGKSARLYHLDCPLSSNKGFKPLVNESERSHLWAQKFNRKGIYTDDQLFNTFEYVHNNREKHLLPSDKKLENLISKMCCSYDDIFHE